MKRKEYEKPSLEVVVLNQKPTLLQGSGQASVQDYTFETENPE